jgi:Predicted membrane protein
MIKFMRENVYAAGIMLLIRLYVGWQWLDAGFHKLKDGFNAGGFLKGAITNPVIDHETNANVYPNFVRFLEHVAMPNVKVINILIPLGETLVGLGLILGALTATAAFFGLLMNFMFLFAGTVSTNPWLLLLGGIVMIAGANGGKFGVDYYLLPLLRKWFGNLRKGGQGTTPPVNQIVK